jgi:hypothetical protein
MTIRISQRSALVILVAVLLALPSIALGTHVFDDVSDGSTHAPGIEWLAGTGVTAGCGGDDFCPGDPVTRAQMATFMHRLSGNAPGIAPSVDSASVGGYGADTFQHRFAESIAFGDSAVLAENGPLVVFANCIQDDGGFDYLRIFVESSASGSYWGTTALTANVAEQITSASVATGDLYNSLTAALPWLVAATGETLSFDYFQHAVINGGGYDCFISGSTQTN